MNSACEGESQLPYSMQGAPCSVKSPGVHSQLDVMRSHTDKGRAIALLGYLLVLYLMRSKSQIDISLYSCGYLVTPYNVGIIYTSRHHHPPPPPFYLVLRDCSQQKFKSNIIATNWTGIYVLSKLHIPIPIQYYYMVTLDHYFSSFFFFFLF